MIHTIVCAVVQNLDVVIYSSRRWPCSYPFCLRIGCCCQRISVADGLMRDSATPLAAVMYYSGLCPSYVGFCYQREDHRTFQESRKPKERNRFLYIICLGIPASSISFKTGHVYKLEMTVPWSNSNTTSQRNGKYSRYFVNSKYSSSTRVASLCITVRLS